MFNLFLRRTNWGGKAVRQAWRAPQRDHPATWLPHQERIEGLVSEIHAEPGSACRVFTHLTEVFISIGARQ